MPRHAAQAFTENIVAQGSATPGPRAKLRPPAHFFGPPVPLLVMKEHVFWPASTFLVMHFGPPVRF